MTEGWIKLHRRLRENWLWEEKRIFSKAEAWIDILLMVNHKENKVPLGTDLIPVEPGSRIISIRQLCERWGWSNTKVKSFLDLLTLDEMITYKSDAKKTVLSVVNWELYQCEELEKTSQINRKNVADQSQKHTNKNDKNEENEKNDNLPLHADPEQELFDYWNQKGIVVHKKITNGIRIALKRVVNIYPFEDIKTAIDRYDIMYRDESYEWCNYKWGLEKFLDDPKGVAFFFDDGQKWLSYESHLQKKIKTETNDKQFKDQCPTWL